jgi:phospholipid/cholesterol/gamma-HCH transport system substrate-binding protein
VAERLDDEQEEGSRLTRAIAVTAVVVAVALVGYLLLFGKHHYEVTAEFQNASQLVKGNQVEVAGVPAGTIKSISLGDHGQALVKMEISDAYAPLRRGTTATARSTSLSGIANRYIALSLPPANRAGAAIPDGGLMSQSETVSEVDLDQIFNSLSKKDIANLKNVIKGFARSYDGVGPQANRGFHYLNPFLSTSRRVFAELNLDSHRFEAFIVDAANLTGALASRKSDLSLLVHNLNLMMGAIGRQASALSRSVALLPPTLREFDTTFVNLRATLDDLDPLVNASKPVAKKLKPFFAQFRRAAADAVPTIKALDHVVSKPGPNNDLTELTQLQVPLSKIAIGPVTANGPPPSFSLDPCPAPSGKRCGAFPETRFSLDDSLPQLAFFRPYITIEGISGWFDDFGHSGIYDANGGIGRISTTFNIFSPSLVPIPIGNKADLENAGLDTGNYKRCPGANERDPGDGSTPFTDGGNLDCSPSEVPVGP